MTATATSYRVERRDFRDPRYFDSMSAFRAHRVECAGCPKCLSTRFWRLHCAGCDWRSEWVDGSISGHLGVNTEGKLAVRAFDAHAADIH